MPRKPSAHGYASIGCDMRRQRFLLTSLVIAAAVIAIAITSFRSKDESSIKKRITALWQRFFRLETNTTQDLAGYLLCKVGEKVRPTPQSTIVFELLRVDTKLQECEFRVVLERESKEFQGTVRRDQVLEFCPKLASIGVTLIEVQPEGAILLVPGLVNSSSPPNVKR
jgi:hypothetical protein